MSILDPIQKQLCVEIWDEKMQLRPMVRKQILDRLYSVLDSNNIDGLFIIGTITGYQYTETSDVDINVSVREYNIEMREAVNKVNGQPLTSSGRHPINFNIKQNSGNEEMWQDAAFGVYNILANDWTKLPPPANTYRDPMIKYKMELDYARIIAEEFNRRLSRIKDSVRVLNKIKKYKWIIPVLGNWYYNHRASVLKQQLQDAAIMAHALEDDRKFTYQWGWGIPREDFRNIVYKYLEHADNGDLFMLLEKADVDDVNEFGPSKEEQYQAIKDNSHVGVVIKTGGALTEDDVQKTMKTIQRSDLAIPAAATAAAMLIAGVKYRNTELGKAAPKILGALGASGAGAAIIDQINKRMATRKLINQNQ